MSKKLPIPKAIKATAWSGVWTQRGYVLGFGVSDVIFVEHNPHPYSVLKFLTGCGGKRRAYLCDITLTPRLDKRGRPITRRVP